MTGDLHVHSTHSDGSETVEAIVKEASKKGISCLSFTEHDSVAWTKQTKEIGKKYNIRIIPGVEISAYDFSQNRKVHILGYNYKNTEAVSALGAPLLKRRDENCRRQIQILGELGYQITVADVLRLTEGTIYKQHILKYLFESGQSEALFGRIYSEIFKNGGPCDFDITYIDAKDAIRAIRQDGGCAVLAHPGQQKTFDLIPEYAQLGLFGVEMYHPDHSKEDELLAEQYCRDFGLMPFGGSDFHGSNVRHQTCLGQCTAPERTLKALTGER